jgi:hypothetical protein
MFIYFEIARNINQHVFKWLLVAYLTSHFEIFYNLFEFQHQILEVSLCEK